MEISNLKILFIQRVITQYRFDLIKKLCNHFNIVGIISSKGTKTGTLKIALLSNTSNYYDNLVVHILPSLKFKYKGESRSTDLFFYPKALLFLKNYDIIVFEGTTNIINNFYLIPYARFLGKKLIFWDAGYSLRNRSFKRKIIDFLNQPLVKLTDLQMAYSSLAEKYLSTYMGGKNAFTNLNTINTSYFEKIFVEIQHSLQSYSFDKNNIRLLYVGVVEKRKKIKELIDIIIKLNKNKKRFSLQVIGAGSYLNQLKLTYESFVEITFLGPIYDLNKLKPFYFKSDLFILPGDGGLAILQSLLFGLPVIAVKGADGTELDYISFKPFLLNDLNELFKVLNSMENIDRQSFYKNMPDITSENWVNNLNSEIIKLFS